MMMPPQTRSRATMTVTGLVPAPSLSSSALSATPKTGFIKPKTETRLTGLTDTMTQSRGTETTGAPARDRGSGLRQCC